MGVVSKPDTCKIISLGSNTDKYNSYCESERLVGGNISAMTSVCGYYHF